MTRAEHAEAISAAGRRRFVDGADVDEVLASFAVNGLDTFEAIRAARLTFDLSLKDARDLVETSRAYSSYDALAADAHKTVLQRLKPELEALRERDR